MSLASTFRQLGAVDGALYLVDRLLRAGSGGRARLVKYRLTAQPIGSAARPMRPDPATRLVAIGAGDALAARFPRPLHVVAGRYAAGARCTAACVKGDFAGFIWIQRDHYDEDELRCRYLLDAPAQSVWDYDVYVEPKYRVGRTMARLWAHVDAELAATGVRWSFSRISAFNRASLTSHARLGTVDCGAALFVALGRLQLAWLPGRAWPHVSADAERTPVIRLRLPG